MHIKLNSTIQITGGFSAENPILKLQSSSFVRTSAGSNEYNQLLHVSLKMYRSLSDYDNGESAIIPKNFLLNYTIKIEGQPQGDVSSILYALNEVAGILPVPGDVIE